MRLHFLSLIFSLILFTFVSPSKANILSEGELMDYHYQQSVSLNMLVLKGMLQTKAQRMNVSEVMVLERACDSDLVKSQEDPVYRRYCQQIIDNARIKGIKTAIEQSLGPEKINHITVSLSDRRFPLELLVTAVFNVWSMD